MKTVNLAHVEGFFYHYSVTDDSYGNDVHEYIYEMKWMYSIYNISAYTTLFSFNWFYKASIRIYVEKNKFYARILIV